MGIYLGYLLFFCLTGTLLIFELSSVIVAVCGWSHRKEGHNFELALLHHLLKLFTGFIDNFIGIDEVIDCDEVDYRSNLIYRGFNILIILYQAGLLLSLLYKKALDKPRAIE